MLRPNKVSYVFTLQVGTTCQMFLLELEQVFVSFDWREKVKISTLKKRPLGLSTVTHITGLPLLARARHLWMAENLPTISYFLNLLLTFLDSK